MGQGAKGSAAESSAEWFSAVSDHHPDGLVVADDQAFVDAISVEWTAE